MFKNYLLVAIRNLRRERLYAVLNVTGLAVGLAVCLLVMAYVVDEWTFDNFHVNGDRLYRVNKLVLGKSESQFEANTPFPLAQFLQNGLPEIQSTVRFISSIESVISSDANSFHATISAADHEFFSDFTFPLLVGDSLIALRDPSSVVISNSMAEKLFGRSDSVGQTVRINIGAKTNDFVVRAVASDPPTNSSITFSTIISMDGLARFINLAKHWGTSWPETYVLLQRDADVNSLTHKLESLSATLPGPGTTTADWKMHLQNIRHIHLEPEVEGSAPNTSSPVYSVLLAVIGFIILELACINFTTLSIGRVQRRVKEIGVRKVTGAGARQIMAQVLGETAIISILALLLAFVLAELCMSHFGTLAGKEFHSLLQAVGWWILLAVWLVLITTFCAGGYPALVLSRIKSISAMTGKVALLTGKNATRALVVAQFVISAALIAVVLSMSTQIDYMLSAPLGFDKANLLMIRLDGTGAERTATIDRLRQTLSSANGVISVSGSGTDFTGGGVRIGNRVGPDSSDFTAFINTVDRSYLATMGLQLVVGDDFAQLPSSESAMPRVIVNETFVKEMRWKDPIGKEMPLIDDSRVVGVVGDFHIQPFTEAIEPVALVEAASDSWAENLGFVLVRLQSAELGQTMRTVEAAWKEIAQNLPFDYEFMDSHVEAQYRSYQRWVDVLSDAMFLAVGIAAFGVLGLTALAVARRRKELSIRKILGAATSQLVVMFCREFVILVVAGNLIAVPLAYWSVSHWLSSFVYRTALSPWSFISGLILLLLIVVITVTLQAYRASNVNPAEAIRYE